MIRPRGVDMENLVIIFSVLTFVLPTVCILADDSMWQRKGE
jgi:hypothetical protein